MEIIYLAVLETHKDNPECPMRIAHHPQGHWYCIDCGLAIYTRGMQIEEIMKDLTAGFEEQYTVAGRGTILMVDLAKVPNINSVHARDRIKVNDKNYEVIGIETLSYKKSYIGIIVKALPV